MTGVDCRKRLSGIMSSSQDAIVAIQPQGCGVPLFLVSPGLEAWSLRRLLGEDRPLFGIRLPDLGRARHLDSLEAIAAHCVRSIRKARPHGPYALAGWCAAGLLGLEIARQLEQSGARVAFVAMLDARGVLLPPMTRGKRRLVQLCHRTQRFTFFLSRVLAEGPVRVRSARNVAGAAHDRAHSCGRDDRGGPKVPAVAVDGPDHPRLGVAAATRSLSRSPVLVRSSVARWLRVLRNRRQPSLLFVGSTPAGIESRIGARA